MEPISLETTKPGWYVVKTEWRSIVVLWVLGLVAARCAVIMPQMLGKTTDLFSQAQSPALREVAYSIGAGVMALLVQCIISYIKNRAEARAQASAGQRMVEATYRHLLRVSPRLFREQEVERINARASNDTQLVAAFFLALAVSMPVAVVSVVYYGFVLAQINWKLTVILLPLSLLSSFFLLFDRQIQMIERSGRMAYDQFRAESSELLTAVDEIRQNAVFDHALLGLQRANREQVEVGLREARLKALLSATMPLISAIQNGAVMFAGAALCLGFFAGSDTPLTWGNVLTFTAMTTLFQDPIQRISGLILEWRLSRVCIQRVEEFWREPAVFRSQPGAPALSSKPVGVTFENASVQIPGGPRILSGLSAKVDAGRHAALVGPSGCGKSTALLLLSRQHDPAGGQVRVDGRPIQEYGIESLAREVGYVAQRPVLFNTSIRHNLLFALRRPSDRVLNDREGPLDVSRWPDVKTIEDVDRRLLETVRQVGLERDVLRKGLDNPLPPLADCEALQRKLVATCSALRERLDRELPGQLLRFSGEGWLEGTLGENIFGPGFSCGGASGSEAYDFLRQNADRAFLDALLMYGFSRYVADETLAMRAEEQAPELLEYLPARQQAARETNSPPPRLDPQSLPPEAHEIFWGIALDSQVGPSAVADGSDSSTAELKAQSLKARARAIEMQPWQDVWDGVARGAWLPHLPVRENLLGGRLRGDVLRSNHTAEQVLTAVLSEHGLLDALLLAGLEFRVGERGRYLSGGQGQKVAIARTLLKEPNLLLLDEATSALDELSQTSITRLIEQKMKGRTVITISHRLVTIKDADPILVLESGRLLEQGRYAELIAQDGLFRKLAQREGESGQPDGQPPADVRTDAGASPGSRAENLQQQLARCDLFAHLDSTNMGFLARITGVVSCKQGQVIFERGDPGAEMFVVLEGQVAFFDSSDPAVSALAVYGADRAFGELALFGNGRRSLTAKAATDVRLAVIGRDNLLGLMVKDPQVALALLRQVSGRLVEVTGRRSA